MQMLLMFDPFLVTLLIFDRLTGSSLEDQHQDLIKESSSGNNYFEQDFIKESSSVGTSKNKSGDTIKGNNN